jgi:hypothetical protein
MDEEDEISLLRVVTGIAGNLQRDLGSLGSLLAKFSLRMKQMPGFAVLLELAAD